jgi:hypothetical protein
MHDMCDTLCVGICQHLRTVHEEDPAVFEGDKLRPL